MSPSRADGSDENPDDPDRSTTPLRRASRELLRSLDLLRTRRFGIFWGAGLLSNIGTWAQWIAEPWLLLGLGASAQLIGLDSFALTAPGWLLTPVGGWLADRSDRRRVIALFQSIQFFCPVLIVALLVSGHIAPWIIIGLAFVVGITDALSMPSFQSIVPSIVEHEQIPPALALNATQFNLSRVLGPAIAGVLISAIGVVACFVLSAISYMPFIAVALWILPSKRVGHGWMGIAGARQAGPARSFAGYRDIVGNPVLRGALLTVFANGLLCGPVATFCSVLVRDVLHGAAGQFSLAMGCFGLGGVLGAIALLAVPPKQDRRRWSWSAAIGYGCVVAMVALDPWAWALPVLMGMAGVAMSLSGISANALIQTTIRRELLGQGVSLFMLAMQGGSSLGSLLTGLSVGAYGVRHALLVNGLLAMIVQGALARVWMRSARKDAAGIP